ncbi:unnamed protein product [Mytilus coruscus]|uniref:Tc1-like transposase DDE domain-containing protein n=1 Tax=Mytilus coruscus TaxID=42192 RepID=A0A6J8D622_MYTCO|nr:unnamed protein product [Mytilus coruscus]
MIRDDNKPKRLNFALRCIATNENFDNAIFTDETTVKIQTSTKYSFRKDDERVPAKGKPKHPYQVHVWGGISRRGATGLFIFTGIMDSIFYQQILQQTFIPFIQTTFPDNHRLIQDNDPKHVSRSTKTFMTTNNINHWPTPPESPDMNPIEMVWAELKHHIRRRKKPKNKQELLDGITEFCQTMTPEKCVRYIDHLYKAIPAVVTAGGAASGH